MNCRLIINKFSTNKSLNIALIKILKTFYIENCIAITTQNIESLGANIPENVEVLDFWKIIYADYQGINWNEFPPLDTSLINKMSKCESIVMKMMERLSFIDISYNERKKIYLRSLRYWYHTLINRKINLFFSTSIPHEIYDFIAYELCKVLSIPTICFHYSTVEGTFFVGENWENDVANRLSVDFTRLKKKNTQEVILSPLFNKHYLKQISHKEDPVPWYVSYSERKMKLRSPNHIGINHLIKKIRKINFEKIRGSILFRLEELEEKARIKKMLSFYSQHSYQPDLAKRYIYCPLHYQPECTTSPMADIFVDQLLIVQMISFFLPQDVMIYVKENPRQPLWNRTIDFYQDLLDVRQVRLIPRDFNSFRLIENSIAVATATGTAGWEALFRQKPVMLFGSIFYQSAPGVFAIRNAKDCQVALQNILTNSSVPNLEDIKLFLKVMEANSVVGYYDQDYATVATVTEEENVNNIYLNLRQKFMGLGFSVVSD